VNEAWPALNEPIINAIGKDQTIDWRSPIHIDGYAEYRDGSFLERVGLGSLQSQLATFWPSRGPQWDALGVTSGETVLLVEAKAHIAELCSPGSSASEASLNLIKLRLQETAEALGAKRERADWHIVFYQLANRLAHLRWLRDQGVDARLVLVNFLNDKEMAGPTSEAEWEAAYRVALHALGLSPRHRLAPYIIEVFPDVGDQASALPQETDDFRVQYCWRCRMDVPVLKRAGWEKMVAAGPEVAAMLARYNAMTGFAEINFAAVMHHRTIDFGPLCESCAKPLRTPEAKFCAECGHGVSTET
jgi:hypothetical protein